MKKTFLLLIINLVQYYLFRNNPDPFNSMTNVKWQMANAGIAKIIIYDLLGKEVATLVNENLQAETYQVNFDGSNSPGEIYFYQLKTDYFTDTKKLIILK